MTDQYTQKVKDFEEGRTLWYEYVKVNGYAFKPTEDDIIEKLYSNGYLIFDKA